MAIGTGAQPVRVKISMSGMASKYFELSQCIFVYSYDSKELKRYIMLGK
jgi:hypothetical protein